MKPTSVLMASSVVACPVRMAGTLRSGFCSLFIFFSFVTNAQTKQTESVQQVWLGYFNQTRFSDKWGVWLDVHLRTKEDFFTNFSQSIIRAGLTYYLTDEGKADRRLCLGQSFSGRCT